jgi:hypothetical protein
MKFSFIESCVDRNRKLPVGEGAYLVRTTKLRYSLTPIQSTIPLEAIPLNSLTEQFDDFTKFFWCAIRAPFFYLLSTKLLLQNYWQTRLSQGQIFFCIGSLSLKNNKVQH